MLFREEMERVLAIPQPTHAWIAGQLLRAWRDPLQETLLFAAEQHDIGWLNWEAKPSFNPATGRPHGFREMPAAIHAPMWRSGIDLALASYGRHVALIVSRHGGLIYRRFARPLPGSEDAKAIEDYFVIEGAREARWMSELGLDEAEARRQSGLVAFADALSLVICGDLKPPLELEAPGRGGATTKVQIVGDAKPFGFRLSPWPFSPPALTLEGEAWRLPATGRFPDEEAFRSDFARARREAFRSELSPG
jgi:Protein of unknown function (DUF3891)